MRKQLIIILLLLLYSGILCAQAPFSFNYQGVARDELDLPLFNQEISLFIEIVRGSEDGTIEYGETHNVRTNDRGLFSLRIGEGDQLIGNLRNIDWGIDRYFIRTAIDFEGGDDFAPLGSSQLYSVPYALYASNTGNSSGGADDQTLSLSGTMLSIENGNSIDLRELTGGSDSDNTDELQTLQLQGQTLSISNGNSIQLPSGGGSDADSDPQNEIQTLSISGQTLSISDGNSITLPQGENITDTDDQSLSLNGTELSIEDGNTVDLRNIGGGESLWQEEGPFSIFYDGVVSVNLLEDRLLTLTDNIDGSGAIEVFGANGGNNFLMTSLSGNANNGILAIADELSVFKLQSYINAESTAESWFAGQNGETNIFLSHINGAPNQGFIGVYGQNGELSSRMSSGNSGQGVVQTSGSNGNQNVTLSWLSGFTNNGYISVHDNQGNEEAGIFVDDDGRGVVFGDVKNFKMNHPTDEKLEIVYASLEGPEAGAYVRGTAKLEKGTATVSFPEHFEYVISGPENMTVIITPLSADSKGIAVIQKNQTGFVVKELLGGIGTYQFDWEAKAIRAGYENYKVVRAKTHGSLESIDPANKELTAPASTHSKRKN